MGLEQFLKNSPLAVAVFDTKMVYLAVSQRWLDDYGLNHGNPVGKSLYELFPAISNSWKGLHQRGLRGETIHSQEDTIIRANGAEQVLRWIIQPWYQDDATIGGIVIISEDITQQKTSERQARLLSELRSIFTKAESPQEVLREVCGKILEYVHCEIFLAYLLDKSSGCLQLKASQGVDAELIAANKWMELHRTICGMEISQPHYVLLQDVQNHPEPLAKTIQTLGLSAYACFPLESEHQILGTIFIGSTTKNSFLPSEVELMLAMTDYVAVSMQRVVDRMMLKEREENLNAVLNSVADAIVSIDPKGIIVSVNPATCHLFGYAKEELLGQNVKILMPSPYREEHDEYIQNYLTTGQAKIIGIGRELQGDCAILG